jgi:hypothetical protein
MFDDFQAVVTNNSITHSSLRKPHNASDYHSVCEMNAAKNYDTSKNEN